MENLADSELVKVNQKKVGRQRKRELNDFKVVLKSVEGRRVIWRILEMLNGYESVTTPRANLTSGESMAYNAGRQDFRNLLLREIEQASRRIYPSMQIEFDIAREDEELKARGVSIDKGVTNAARAANEQD